MIPEFWWGMMAGVFVGFVLALVYGMHNEELTANRIQRALLDEREDHRNGLISSSAALREAKPTRPLTDPSGEATDEARGIPDPSLAAKPKPRTMWDS